MKFNNLIDKYISNIYEDANLGGILNAAAVIADDPNPKNPGPIKTALQTSAKTVVKGSRDVMNKAYEAFKDALKAGMK